MEGGGSIEHVCVMIVVGNHGVMTNCSTMNP